MNSTFQYLQDRGRSLTGDLHVRPTLLALSLSLVLPGVYYGLVQVQKTQFFKSHQSYYQDIKVLVPFIKPKDSKEFRYAWYLLSAIFVCVGIGRAGNIYTAFLLRSILSQLAARAFFPWKAIVLFVFLQSFVRNIMTYVQWNITRRLENQVADRITIAIYNKIMNLSAGYHDNKNSTIVWQTVRTGGEKVSKFASKICFEMIPNALDLVLSIYSFGTVCGARLGWVMVASQGAYGVIMASMSSLNNQYAEEWRQAIRKKDNLSSDAILNWWTVMLFGRLDYEKDRHAQAVHYMSEVDTQWTDSQWLTYIGRHTVHPFGHLILCLLVGYDIWSNPTREAGDFALFLHLWRNVISPSVNIMGWNDRFRDFSLDVKRLIEIIQEEIAVKDIDGAKDLESREGNIRIDDVSFSYPGKTQPALEDVSISIPSGDRVAIVGRSGGGKSTLLKLLMRGYDPTSGRIYIDGQNIATVRKDSLMKHISIVPQNISVFNASILENLRYARLDATLEQCEAACRAVELHDKITTSFENGYDEVLGEKGAKLSGGELQRLAIARLLLKDTQIVLLDEMTSNLDAETEEKIQKYLSKWCAGRTVVIVAHRLATVLHADLILAVQDGAVVESGSYDELLQKKGYFYELWNKQRLT